MSTAFARILINEMQKRGITRQADLARLLGKHTATVSRWLSGAQDPSFTDAQDVLTSLGWNLSLADPVWSDASSNCMVRLAGTANAEDGRVAPLSRTFFAPEGWEWLLASPWKETTGETVYIAVDGDHLAPTFGDGSLIACRRPTDIKHIPPLATCVFREGTVVRIGRYQSGPPGYIAILPVTPRNPAVFVRDSRVIVDYIVVGHIAPDVRGEDPPARQRRLELVFGKEPEWFDAE